YGERSIYDVDFRPVAGGAAGGASAEGAGLTLIDHLTHNVGRGRMDVWAGFYQRLFNFREIRYFDIEGERTGLLSRAMTSPCGKIRIPINESQDDKSQIEEYLREYHGEGIQHIALATEDIYRTVDVLRGHGVAFQDTPDTYYENLAARVPGHRESLTELRSRRILIDGNPQKGEGVLLQIFTRNVIGPIFFEIIQRKGNEGFGELGPVLQAHEQHDTHIALPVLGYRQRLENLRQALDRGIDLRGADAHTARIQHRIRAPVDHHSVMLGERRVVAVAPDTREALEVGGAVLRSRGVVPEPDRHRREWRRAHQLAALPAHRPAGVVEDVDRHAESAALDLAPIHRPRRTSE